MLKALMKKQLLQLLHSIRMSGGGKKRSGGVVFAVIFCIVICFTSLAFAMFEISRTFVEIYAPAGILWFFMLISGAFSLAAGVVGSVFSAYSQLYTSRENDLLLSMPIPPEALLFARMLSVALFDMLFVLVIQLPAFIACFMETGFRWKILVFDILLFIGITLAALALSSLLAFLISFIASRLKGSSFLKVGLTLVFLTLYYVIYFQFIQNAEEMAKAMMRGSAGAENVLNPFYHYGMAATGNGLSLAIFLGIALLLFALVCRLLSRSYVRLLTVKKGGRSIRYQEKKAKVHSLDNTLLRKEFLRLKSSASYMLNGGLGIVMMPVLGIFFYINRNPVLEALDSFGAEFPEIRAFILPLSFAAAALASSMNVLAGPSVSLESTSLWVTQSMPIPMQKLIRAKIRMHLILTALPVCIPAAAFALVFRMDPLSVFLLFLTLLLFVLYGAEQGMFFGILFPRMDWDTEAQAVKSGFAVLLSLFAPWAAIAASVGLAVWLVPKIGDRPFLLLLALLFLAAAGLFHRYNMTKGARKLQVL